MRAKRYTFTAVFFLILCQATVPAFGQLGFSFNLKGKDKPKEYEDRELRMEKEPSKNFGFPKRQIQNATIHYNYFFNANNKLNEILERAKLAHKDDYSQLLSFYNYTLDATIADSIQLDSITYKASTAIALHDLRSDWADNMYLLWGASYYLQKKFDSAYLMFQFINYAFAPKEKDGYYITIGSPKDGNSANSISTKEKTGLPRKIFSEPPSRNDAFIWQIRNSLAQDELTDAASLIVTLRGDPSFPKRLKNDLAEVQAYWFYKQQMWDSAALHLENALDNAVNKQEKARWEFLLAQLYELTGNTKEAESYYAKVSKHTTDPIMDIYARLFSIRANKDGGEKSIEKNIATLLRMAKQDKYEEYRDIIYYTAAQMQLDGNNTDAAMSLLLKSTQYTVNNAEQRNKAFLQLAELSFARQQYREAANYYDSLQLDDPSIKNADELRSRKNALRGLANNLEIVEKEDSLQRVAAMPDEARKDFVKNLVKTLRKQQGMKDEPTNTSSPFPSPTNPGFPPSQPKGAWYFDNAAARSRGQIEFKNKWGVRPNVDNWRRSAILSAIGYIPNQTQPLNNTQTNNTTGPAAELTYEGLYSNLPLSPEQMKKSNDTLQAALFAAGKIYVQQIEDCGRGIPTFERIRNNFPDFKPMDEVLFNLYYCYTKSGETAKADAIKKLMAENYGMSPFTSIITTGKDPRSNKPSSEGTKVYEKIYDLFIEGNFEQAIAEKKTADSKYGSYFWTPQLLYIEAVYYIKQRNDSTAMQVLNALVTQFAGTPMAVKAANLIDVLTRRAQIEKELKDLVVTRKTDDPAPVTNNTITNPAVTNPTTNPTTQPTIVTNPPPVRDTSATGPKPMVPYKFTTTDAHYVVIVLTKVDKVYVNEAKSAFERFNRENIYNKRFAVNLADFDADNKLLFISPFKNATEAVAYIDQVKPRTAADILPWLKNGKYSYIILSDANYDALKSNSNIDAYKAFLNQQFPGKF